MADLHQRELSASTYIGAGIAVPQGPYWVTGNIRDSAIAVLQFPRGVIWDGSLVLLCVGLAATGDQQISIMCSLAKFLLNPARAAELVEATDPDRVVRLLRSVV
jgi:mannitol PTS system EIIA component